MLSRGNLSLIICNFRFLWYFTVVITTVFPRLKNTKWYLMLFMKTTFVRPFSGYENRCFNFVSDERPGVMDIGREREIGEQCSNFFCGSYIHLVIYAVWEITGRRNFTTEGNRQSRLFTRWWLKRAYKLHQKLTWRGMRYVTITWITDMRIKWSRVQLRRNPTTTSGHGPDDNDINYGLDFKVKHVLY